MKFWKRRQETPAVELDPSDLRLFGDVVLEYLRNLPAEEIARRLEEISLDGIRDDADFARAQEILDREGIVIVRNFLSEEVIALGERASDRVKAALDKAPAGTNVEDDEIFLQGGEEVVKVYADLAAHPKSIITVRKGADAGMVDVFNIDRLIGEDREALRAPFLQDWLLKLISEKDETLTPDNMNLYLNRGIEKTRGFHADSYRQNLKGFVYLSDVTGLGDGPYCFVRRSHKDGPWRRANKKISELAANKKETPFVDLSMIVPVIAPRGSFVLSDQAGFHRGIPQAPGAERRVLVMRYQK